MKSKKVIKPNNLPSRLPISSTLITAIALDYWHAPQWLWGAMGLFFIFVWTGCIIGISTEEKVDLFEK